MSPKVAVSLVLFLQGLVLAFVPEVSNVRVIAQLPAPAFFESIAIRPSGDLLANLLVGGPSIYSVSDPSGRSPSFSLITSIPAVNALGNMVEVRGPDGEGLDKYVVTGGNSSTAPPDFIVGSWGAWLLSFDDSYADGRAIVKQINDLSAESAVPNGLVAVPGAVLIADSARGSIGRLDLSTNDFEDAIVSLPEMLPQPGSDLGIGINGIKIFQGHLYFTNSDLASVYRFPVTKAGYPTPAHMAPAAGQRPELVANVSSTVPFVDNFALDACGNIYLTSNRYNQLLYIDGETREVSVLVGGLNDSTVAGASSAAFGRTAEDSSTLYLSAATVNIGAVNVGGRILAVEF